MEFNAKILFISRYDFVSDLTGEQLKGCKVTFVMEDETNTDNFYGRRVYTGICPFERFDEIKTHKLPLNCKVIYEQVSLDTKPRFKDIKFIN